MEIINLTENSLNYILSKVDNVRDKKSLDIFAREGNWQTNIFINKVRYNESWEIDPVFVENFKINFPNYNIICRDSIEYINNSNVDTADKFDIVVIDNGLKCYGKNNQYCEHFDVIDNIYKFFSEDVFVIFNVVKSPFNYDDNIMWKSRRESFYKTDKTDNLSLEFLMDFYKKKFLDKNYESKNIYVEPREIYNKNVYLYYFAFHMARK